MSEITDETVEMLAKLCRIDCDKEMCHEIQQDLEKVLAYFDQLAEVDTEDVPPCNNVLAGMVNVDRPDVVNATLTRKTFLDATPDQVGGMVRVPPVIRGKTKVEADS